MKLMYLYYVWCISLLSDFRGRGGSVNSPFEDMPADSLFWKCSLKELAFSFHRQQAFSGLLLLFVCLFV